MEDLLKYIKSYSSNTFEVIHKYRTVWLDWRSGMKPQDKVRGQTRSHCVFLSPAYEKGVEDDKFTG